MFLSLLYLLGNYINVALGLHFAFMSIHTAARVETSISFYSSFSHQSGSSSSETIATSCVRQSVAEIAGCACGSTTWPDTKYFNWIGMLRFLQACSF